MFKPTYIAPLFFALVARISLAQEIPESCPGPQSDPESAKALAGIWFNKAEDSVKQEKYAEALGEFRCSLQMVEHPATSYNAALAAQKAGYLSIALKLANLSVELDPTMEEHLRPLIQELEQALEKSLQTGDGNAQTLPTDSTEGGETDTSNEPVEPDQPIEPEPTEVQPPEETQPEPAPDPEPAKEPSDTPAAPQNTWLISTGYATLGLGAVALITSGIIGGVALSIDGELESDCVDGHCPPDQESKIDRMNAMATATNVLIGVGAAGVTAGVAMLIWGYKNKREASGTVSIAPLASPVTTGVAIQGRF